MTDGWEVDATSPSTFRERLLGLHDQRAGPNLLLETRSVHTFGLGRSLDVVVIGPDRSVVDIRSLAPNRVLVDRRARYILEMPEQAVPPRVGAQIVIVSA